MYKGLQRLKFVKGFTNTKSLQFTSKSIFAHIIALRLCGMSEKRQNLNATKKLPKYKQINV